MRQADKVWDVWDNGAYIGDRRSHARVTVQPDWVLNKTGTNYASSRRGPFRWFQDASNLQSELEIPFVKSITIDRSIDTDIATCEVSIYNQYMNNNGQIPDLNTQLGTPGYFTWNHGRSPEAVARWNQSVNVWENILIPNALIRTYQGYGGFNSDGTPMEIDEAIDEGYIVLTGVWLVDTVTVGSNGMLNLRTRDVGKLLQVQQYFPELVPSKFYLEQWCRWSYQNFDASFDPRLPATTIQEHEVSPIYSDSSADRWNGPNAIVHGHRGTDSTDGNDDTFALSLGNPTANGVAATEWFQYEVNADLNAVYILPWAGNYETFVSIMEEGDWVSNGEGNIPYDSTGQDVDTGADIPYVLRSGIPWEQGIWFELPRFFRAQKIRITFRNLTLSSWGTDFYRCGIREIKVRVTDSATANFPVPFIYGIAAYNDPDVLNESGYWCVSDAGQVFAFGDAREHIKTNPHPIDDQVLAIKATPTSKGYYTMQINGVVHTYGDAVFQGDYFSSISSSDRDFVDMTLTRTGNGYWLLRRTGEVYAFGDAVHYGNATTASIGTITYPAYSGTGIESHPTLDGYWVVDGNGEVEVFGDLPDYGGITPFRHNLESDEWIRGIRRNSTGSGYYILTGTGDVIAKGAATDLGQISWPDTFTNDLMSQYLKLTYDMMVTPDDTGILVVRANGHIEGLGDFDYFGEPGGQGLQRTTGTYNDYSDIVKTLLAWSGFLYYTPDIALNGILDDVNSAPDIPPVYGNIESTGAYADECLSLSEFDKKPILDCINTLKEIVGFISFIDDEGGFVFRSPNFWSIGNFWQDGTPTDFIPEIDERTVLTEYSVNFSDETARSEIIISTEDPTKGNTSTVVTRIIPATASILRGIEKPAMWANATFKNPDEQEIMAELIGMHIWFQQRTGEITCAANPCIGIDDQVRIFERNASDSYVHYVRSVNTIHDLDSGNYTSTLSTHWLGDAENWVITRDQVPSGSLDYLPISDKLVEWLKKSDSRVIQVARLNDFGSTAPPPVVGPPIGSIPEPPEPGVDPGDIDPNTLLLPSEGSTWFGMWTSIASGQKQTNLQRVTRFDSRQKLIRGGYGSYPAVNHVDIGQFFFAWDNDIRGPDSSMSMSLMEWLHSKNVIPMTTWQPGKKCVGGMEAIRQGIYDDFIRMQATRLKNLGFPIFLRFAYEMNVDGSPWCPWHKESDTYTNPAATRTDLTLWHKAWRRVYHLFKNPSNGQPSGEPAGVSAANVVFVWCAGATSSVGVPNCWDFYPGDDYVDWVGFDAYGGNESETWASNWDSILDSTQVSKPSVSYNANKPIMICETASLPSIRENFVNDAAADLISRNNYVRAVMWFDENKEHDWRLQDAVSTAAKNAELSWINRPEFNPSLGV